MLWDVNPKIFDFAKNAAWLIERVFNRGEMSEVFEIMACYEYENVQRTLLNAEILELMDIAAMKLNTISDIPKII